MKVESKKEFSPIVITIETQDEFDQVFAVANHSYITEMVPVFEYLFDELDGILKPINDDEYWQKLDNIIKKRK